MRLLAPFSAVLVLAACWAPPSAERAPGAGSSASKPDGKADEAPQTASEYRRERALKGATSGPATPIGPLTLVDIDTIRVQSDVQKVPSDWGRLAQCFIEPSTGLPSPFTQMPPLGQVWYAFGDEECHTGVSVSFVSLLSTGATDGECTLRWAGRLDGKILNPFAGIGVDLERDMSGVRQILMDVRGDGNTYRAELVLQGQLDAASRREECDARDWDFYGDDFVCGDGTDAWKEVVIDLGEVEQRGFGDYYDLASQVMEKFQIVTTRKDAHDFQCEFRVVAVK